MHCESSNQCSSALLQSSVVHDAPEQTTIALRKQLALVSLVHELVVQQQDLTAQHRRLVRPSNSYKK